MGFDAHGVVSDSVEELKNASFPCILNVTVDEICLHYIVCYGYEGGLFLIGDPNSGVNKYTESQLKEKWNGYCLFLQPNSFELKESINKRKREWVFNLVREDWGLLISSLIIGIITTILGLSMTIFSQILVDEILPDRNVEKIIVGLSIVLIVSLCSVLFSALRSKLILTQSKDFNNRVIRFFFKQAIAFA